MTHKKFLIFIFIFLMLAAPAISFAGGLVPDCVVDTITRKCIWGFNEFMKLIHNMMNFILFSLAVPIGAIMFAYAGFKLVISGGNAEAKTRAKTIFFHAVLGIVIAAGAWLIVKTILDILGYKGSWIGF